MKKLILASASPRRKQLLTQIGLKFEVRKSNYNETPEKDLTPAQLALFYSQNKAKDVASKASHGIVIGADTLVVFENQAIGKPKSKDDAIRILSLLSGKMHEIVTGYTLIDTKTKKTISRTVTTKVWFRKLSKQEIVDYVATGEPFDKAGAYGIQEKGALFVEKIDGDYFNVVGLPIAALVTDLKKMIK